MKSYVNNGGRCAFFFVISLMASVFVRCGDKPISKSAPHHFSSNSVGAYPRDGIKEEKVTRWKRGEVYVTKVIDGDTFWVDNGTERFKVRFIGIDAPETRNSRGKLKGPFAREAKEYVQRLTENKWVRLDQDVQKKDRYHRVLAYIYLLDGTFLNAELVKGGFAVVDTYPPNVKHVELLLKLQQEARDNKRGLWGY